MSTDRNFTAIGIDGCKGGWFYVQISLKGEFGSDVICDLKDLLDGDEPRRILIDIPIGFPDQPGGPCCERLAWEDGPRRLGSHEQRLQHPLQEDPQRFLGTSSTVEGRQRRGL
ncbi:MAG: DUF429 domain-containing protein [Gammaproteobacteria bacterium]|nr:DUF429 domain-containing protein [Gammaproteobacteria bacterium]